MHPGSSPPALPRLAESLRVVMQTSEKTPLVLRPPGSCAAPVSEISSGMPDPTSGLEELNPRALGARGRSWLTAPPHPVQVPYDRTSWARLQCLPDARPPPALSFQPGVLPAPGV